jgi:hypothetical protein
MSRAMTLVEGTNVGFSVTDRLTGNRVDVIRRPTHFEIVATSGLPVAYLGLFSYNRLLEQVAHRLLAGWRPGGEAPPAWLHRWKVKKTRRIIGKAVHTEWRRAHQETGAAVLDVQRAVFAATFRAPDLLFAPALYEQRDLVRDIIRYPACAHAVACAPLLVPYREERRVAADLEKYGLAVVSWEPPLPDALIDSLALDWRGLFSPDGASYRSLNRTLMNLPGRVPTRLMTRLPHVRLARPVTERVELTTVLSAVPVAATGADHTEIFLHARREQITRAFEIVAAHLREPLRLSRSRDIERGVRFLADYPHAHRGNVVGLARASVGWHRERQDAERQRAIVELGSGTETAKPPVPLPDDPQIRFLPTVADVLREGAQMGHCIASYARRAVDGDSYLFHVERGGEHATVEVGAGGLVLQASGPANRMNGASTWGRRTLGEWAKAFPRELPSATHIRGPLAPAAPPVPPRDRFRPRGPRLVAPRPAVPRAHAHGQLLSAGQR